MSPDPDGFTKALDLLARRPHFRRELAVKLARRGFDEEEVGVALDRLEDLGYLDDRACARDLAAGALRRRGYGPVRVRAELERRGVPEEVIDEVLTTMRPEDERSLALETARRWRGGRAWGSGAGDRKERERLARHLARKGFSAGVILAILEDLPAGEVSDSP